MDMVYNGLMAPPAVDRGVIRSLERALGADGVLWRPEDPSGAPLCAFIQAADEVVCDHLPGEFICSLNNDDHLGVTR